jgi:hypothetical protein
MNNRALSVDASERTPPFFAHKYLPPAADGWHRRGVWADGSCFYHSLACIIDYEANGKRYHQASRRDKCAIGHALRRDVMACLTPDSWDRLCRAHGIQGLGPCCSKMRKEMQCMRAWRRGPQTRGTLRSREGKCRTSAGRCAASHG